MTYLPMFFSDGISVAFPSVISPGVSRVSQHRNSLLAPDGARVGKTAYQLEMEVRLLNGCKQTAGMGASAFFRWLYLPTSRSIRAGANLLDRRARVPNRIGSLVLQTQAP